MHHIINIALPYVGYFIFVWLVFAWIHDRTLKKTKVELEKPWSTEAVFYFSSNNTKLTGTITFYPDKYITINAQNNTELKIDANTIKKLNFKLTSSLATSYFMISLTDGNYIMVYNDVTEAQLDTKLQAVAVDAVLGGSTVSGIAMAKSGLHHNIFWTSDEHTPMHVWFTKNKFPGYSQKLVTSDWLGFGFIIILPTMIYLGATIENITSKFAHNQGLGSAIMGFLVLSFIFFISIYRVRVSLSLNAKINKARSITSKPI